MEFFQIVKWPEVPATSWRLSCPIWLEDRFRLNKGLPVNDWDSDLFFIRSQNEPPLDFENSEDWQWVSGRLRLHLTRLAPGCFQFLPFRIRTAVGEVIPSDYVLLNYLVWHDAVDKRRSRLAEGEKQFRRHSPDGEYYIEHLVLNAAKCSSPVFRVIGQKDAWVYRDDVAEALIRENYAGLEFQKIDS